MSPIDVALVRSEDDLAPIVRERRVLDLELARRQERRFPSGGGNRVELCPSVLLPRKDEAIALRPQDLVLCDHLPKGAPSPLVRAKDGATVAGLGVGDADGPGKRYPLRKEGKRHPLVLRSKKREPASVGRPDGRNVLSEAGVEVADRIAREGIDSDERVVSAVAHERELLPVRREAKRARAPARLRELFRLGLGGVGGGGPDLSGLHENDGLAVGGNARLLTLSQLPGRDAAVGPRDPDRLRGAARVAHRVRNLSGSVRSAAANEDDFCGSRTEAELGELLAFVPLILEDRARSIVRGERHPYAPEAAVVLGPGEGARHRARTPGPRETASSGSPRE